MASLTDTPRGHELEEYFAALLQATGHYVEKNVMDPNIAWSWTSWPPTRTGWRPFTALRGQGNEYRLEDVFKLIGHMAYLSIREGAFLARPSSRGPGSLTGSPASASERALPL